MDNLDVEASSNQMVFETINIANGLDGEADLEFSVLETDYKLSDSNGDIFDSNWIELDNPTTIVFADNDNAPSPINIGVDFPFDNRVFNQCTVNPNGWIGLDGDSNAWNNSTLPTEDVPGAAIFGMWDDLNHENAQCNQYCAGQVYYQQFPDKFVVTFDNVAHWWTNFENTFYDFQVVLYPSGKIDLNYRSLIGDYDASVGIQKNATVGTQVLYGTDDLSNNLNVTFDASPQWLTINPDEGTLMEGQSALISLIVNTNNLVDGDYNGYLRILSNGGNATLPVNLTVNGSLLGDTNGDSVINVLDVIIMVNMILGLTEIDLNTADMNSDGVVNVLDITLLLNIILNG